MLATTYFAEVTFYKFSLSSGYFVNHDNEELIALAKVTVRLMPKSLPSAFNTKLFFVFILVRGFI